MPTLYKNNNNKMFTLKPVLELSQSQAQYIVAVQPRYQFSTQEAEILVSIVKAFIDPNQQGCSTCGDGHAIRSAKDKIVKYYRQYQSTIEAIADGSYVAPVVEEEKPEVDSSLPNLTDMHKKIKKRR